MSNKIPVVVMLVAAACSNGSATPTTSETSAPSVTSESTTVVSAPTTTAVPVDTTIGETTTQPPACPAIGGAIEEGAAISDVVLAAYPIAGGEPVWSVPLNGELVSMSIGPSLLYIGSLDGVVIALDPDTCRQVWRRAIGLNPLNVTAAGDLVAVDGIGLLALLDAETGRELWTVEPPLPFGVVEAVIGDVILMTIESYGAMTFDVETGALLLDFSFENAPLLTVTASDELVYAGGAGIIARPTRGGDTVWESDVDADVLGIEGDALIAATNEGLVTAMDAATGAQRWQVHLEGIDALAAPPAVAHGEIHLLDSNGNLHHLDATTGAEVFVGELAPALTFPELDDGLLLIEELGVVTAVDLGQRRRWGIETGANGVDRFTRIEVYRNLAIALTFSERPA